MTEEETMAKFQRLDGQWDFQKREDLYKRIEKLGYTFVSECLTHLYYVKKKSIKEVAKTVEVCEYTIVLWFKRWNYKFRPRGGNNRNPLLEDPAFIQKIRNLKGTMTSTHAETLVDCSAMSIRAIWKNTP